MTLSNEVQEIDEASNSTRQAADPEWRSGRVTDCLPRRPADVILWIESTSTSHSIFTFRDDLLRSPCESSRVILDPPAQTDLLTQTLTDLNDYITPSQACIKPVEQSNAVPKARAPGDAAVRVLMLFSTPMIPQRLIWGQQCRQRFELTQAVPITKWVAVQS